MINSKRTSESRLLSCENSKQSHVCIYVHFEFPVPYIYLSLKYIARQKGHFKGHTYIHRALIFAHTHQIRAVCIQKDRRQVWRVHTKAACVRVQSTMIQCIPLSDRYVSYTYTQIRIYLYTQIRIACTRKGRMYFVHSHICICICVCDMYSVHAHIHSVAMCVCVSWTYVCMCVMAPYISMYL